jgi:hypothetical protein
MKRLRDNVAGAWCLLSMAAATRFRMRYAWTDEEASRQRRRRVVPAVDGGGDEVPDARPLLVVASRDRLRVGSGAVAGT